MSRGTESIDAIVQQGYSVKAGAYISRGWELFKQNPWPFIGFTLVQVLIAVLLGQLQQKSSPLATIINLVISGPLTAGWFIVAFKLIKNRPSTFGDFFRGFNNFLPFFLVSLISGILVALGLLLFILPGIYLAVAYTFALPLAVGKRLDFWEAIEGSRKIITKNWFGFFGFVLLLLLINIGGALLLGIGLLVTIPLTYASIAAAYDDIVGVGSSTVEDLP